MKKICSLLLLGFFVFYSSQKVELKSVTDSSQTFKGEIAGVPITIQLNYAGIVDCDQYQHYVDGWYYYDKYQKKIYLTGIYDFYGNLSLYNFGAKHKQKSKVLKEEITSRQKIENTNEIAQKLSPQESLIFEQPNPKENAISGTFYMNKKTAAAKLFTANDMIYRYNNYLILPNHKKINTFDFINRAGGNSLVSTASDHSGHRVLLYFEEVSNFNFCGMCGASDGEKGYRVLYFTKDWNYKHYDQFLTESCREGISETEKIKTKDPKILQFKIPKSYSSPAYTLTVDTKNSSITKSK
ncbi:hypothetical protein C1637_03105 [Chryseobacterium lactis]|uniref:Uncharacterized protein n=1 Tax=Chryseobacterium lactis TaxID=1241981 RepID=A0A3G6RNX2_CHRLC|nr:hypothetical protein [Chryseobacterium lactis]AZA81574.1 hypothetical protein EG342_06500 [Chryseobacterium lactis]AZB06572.1 hypothetical protein EG341_22620 [Chryseobacterium lactis]PNW15423.1 hypothetical protein C1637_03105 [Chryseobacterium lactis]